MSLATPLSAGRRGKCVHGSSRSHYRAQVSDRCNTRQNKTHTFSKIKQNIISAYHNHPALMQPVCTSIQDDHFEIDPPANMPRRLVHQPSIHHSAPLSQTILEIRIRRGVSIQGPAVWAILSSPHIYTMHGCSSLPSATNGNPHTQLPRRLAHSGPVVGGFNIAQEPPPQPLRLPGAQGQI